MKTISKRFLKGGLAVLLAVIMLFSSCITGFAAVVDNAQTGANSVSGGYLYFDNTKTQWSDTYIYFCIGHSSYTSLYRMTKLTGTNLYYCKMDSWSGSTYYAVIGNGSSWGSGSWGSSNLTNANHRTAAYTSTYGLNSGSYYVFSPSSSSNGCSLTISYKGTAASSVNTTNYAYAYSSEYGAASYSSDSSAGTVSLSSKYLSSYSAVSTRSASSTLGSTYTASGTVALSASTTLTATAADGYTFKGWSTSTSESGIVSTSTSYTYTAGHSGYTKYYALFEKTPSYTLTYDANGGEGAPDAVTDIAAATTLNVSTTEPTRDGYNFKGWNTLSDGSGFDYAAGAEITVNEDITLYAKWAKVHTITYDANGGSGAPDAGTVEDGQDYTIPSTHPTYTNYNFKGWEDANGATYEAGATIAAVSSDMTLTAQWELAGTCSPAMSGITLDIDETGTVTATTNDFCTAGGTFTYSIADGSEYISLSGNTVTPKKPGTAHITATCSCGETVTCAVTVNTPELSIDPEEIKLLVGQTMTNAFNASANVGNPTITITSDDEGVATVTDGKATAVAAGNTDITASFKFNSYYTDTIKANVSVSDPTITADPTTLALEFYADGDIDTESGTFTVTTNADASDVACDAVTVSSSKEDVATAEIDADGKVTVTATGVGTTTITANFHGATVEVLVTVTEYDPNVYVYFRNDWNWSTVSVYAWGGDYSSTTGTFYEMVKIGTAHSEILNENRDLYAYKFSKDKLPNNIIFLGGTNWSNSTNQTPDITFVGTKAYSIKYVNQNVTLTYDYVDSRSAITAEDVTVSVGGTADLTTTVVGDYTPSQYEYVVDNTATASVTGTTATATVEGLDDGETSVTVYAYAQCNVESSSTQIGLVTVATSAAAKEYVAKSTTAKITVADVDCAVSVDAAYSNDGITYTTGTTGGTATYTGDATVSYGTEIELTATPADGYRFFGWYLGDVALSTDAEYTHKVTNESTALTAKFVKQYNVTVIIGDGIDFVKINNDNYNEDTTITVDAGAAISAYASPAENFKFTSWDVTGATLDDATIALIEELTVAGDITLTANAAPVYSAVATAHCKYGTTTGGTVTVNGAESPYLGEVGDTVTYSASATTTYRFYGWYSSSDFTTDPYTTDAQFDATLTADGLSYHALFVKDLYINGEQLTYDPKTDSYSLTTDYADTFTVKDDHNSNVSGVTVPAEHIGATVTSDGTTYTFTPDTVNYDTTQDVTYLITANGDGTYTLNAALTAKPRFSVTFNGESTSYAVGATVELTATPEAGEYLSGASATPAVDGISADKTTGTITFVMPANHVTVEATYDKLAQINFNESVGLVFTGTSDNGYYIPGESVTITVAPQSEKVTILGMTSTAGDVTDNGDGTYTLTVTPGIGEVIDVTLTVDAKFTMNYGVKSIGDFGTSSTASQYGTVKMTKADGTEITSADVVEKTDVITYTAVAGDNYIFDGFYSEPTCSILNIITRESTYEVTPTADTTIYALFVRKQYIDLDSNTSGTSDQHEMTYEPKTRTFTYTTVAGYSRTAWFSITNDKSSWVDTHSYGKWTGNEFAVTFNATAYNAYVGWGNECFKLTDAAGTGQTPAAGPFQIVLRINENSAIDVSARAKKTTTTAYLSYGRGDIVTATSTVTDTTGLTVSAVKNAYNDINTSVYEKYVTITSSSDYSLSFQTQLTGDTAADYYIDKFVVYHMDTRTYSIIEPNPLGNNTYSGSVYVDSDCYIVPIFFHTTEYAEANGLVEIDVYFDATAVDMNTWGPFVSCYTYGASTTEFDTDGKAIEEHYCGGWPGQLMIPTEDGSSFYTMITVPKADAENPTSIPQGILFSNYMQASVVTANAGAFGVYNEQQQTYDYREAITLYNNGVEVITFTAKNSTDGYHGDSSSVNNYNTTNTVSASKTDLSKYSFEYLYNRDGVTPMDFYADDITSPKNLDTTGADYYVITRGDVPYGPYVLDGTTTTQYGATYAADEDFKGEWCVEWYIFDKEGNFLTKVLSDALFNVADNNGVDSDADNVPLLVEALAEAQGVSEADIAGKTVAISYEAPNNDKNNTHQVSYDGQWYGNMLSDFVHGNVIVGLEDENGKFNLDTDEEDHIADYGQGYLVDENGDKWGDLDVTLDLGEADLSATPAPGYYFVGWYTYVRGEYVRISPSPEYNAYINMNTTYYAIFKEIGPGEVVINHLLYNNPDDPYIPSHGGAANMLVEVYNNTTGDVIQKGVISNSVSTVVFEGEAGIDYRIDITTTPLMGGSFFAWYTDSEDADGNATYEEILTTEEVVGSETTVTSSFYYSYTEDSQRLINIYSDIKRVSSYADIVYKYYNRNGEVRTYTVKDVPLTDEECDGYAGTTNSDGVTYTYCPTFNTRYAYKHETSGDIKYSGLENDTNLISQGYLPDGTYNAIHQYAPSQDVTQAIDEIVSWEVAEVNLEIDKSYVVVWADQADIEFTITAITPDGAEIAKQSGPYNTLAVGIDAPKTFDGKEFSYWIDNETGEILSYLIEYNYRIVEDKVIMAVYGEEVADWTPVIDSVTYTREYQDTSDYVYSDFLITFNSSKDQELDVMKANGENVKYGLIMVRDKNYKYEGSNTTLDPVVYPNADSVSPEMETAVSTILSTGNNYGFDGVDINGNSTRYLAYHYDLTNYESTNFNRMEYYIRYNNQVLNNRKYAFKAYVYLVVDNTTYISEPVDVNIYDAATAPVEQ